MNVRENTLAILHYQPYDAMPIVAFGYWDRTVDKWRCEGHITEEDAQSYHKFGDSGDGDLAIMKKLGFDFNWGNSFSMKTGLYPEFEKEVLQERPDGSRIARNSEGLIVLENPGIVSIPSEIGTSLEDRESWEKLYKPKLQWSEGRIDFDALGRLAGASARDAPYGLSAGSLIGIVRNYLGVEQMSYLAADDMDLFIEIIDTVGELSYNCVKAALESGATFDFAHYWEDICFKNGPLVIPSVFDEYVGPHYKRTTDLLKSYGVDIVSVDCDGLIDSLIPTWLKNGVNTMFPIEVGTWGANIKPWREKWGKELRGVGGVNKNVFSLDFKAVDEEVERLRPLVESGGFIPCPDHRIAPDAKFENVQHYCEKMRRTFQGSR
ncbi:MAG: uroporphyrinogen decarboxylase family protein [Clostridiales bacterium]|jgi:uroporphyrinogen decarboxylase|nr:uroporphyrinogen decarboxylase family protein [Clostridiales bacterium]